MEHDKIEVEKKVLSYLSCVSDVLRLGKWKPGKNDQRPRTLLLSFTNPWTVQKFLSRAHTMNGYNKANNCKLHVGKMLTKDERDLKRTRLFMRWKLINEKNA